MFGRKDKLQITIIIDNTVDIRAVRDFLISVALKKFSFIKHASASFGILSNNVVAEDYEASRAYETIGREVLNEQIEDIKLQQLKDKVSSLQDEIDERIALN